MYELGIGKLAFIANPEAMLKQLLQVAPPHLPCDSPRAGATEMLMPGIGWANAVPDAKATVNFEVAGKKLAFSGVGYHDKVRLSNISRYILSTDTSVELGCSTILPRSLKLVLGPRSSWPIQRCLV